MTVAQLGFDFGDLAFGDLAEPETMRFAGTSVNTVFAVIDRGSRW
jgi:hypothetical protein